MTHLDLLLDGGAHVERPHDGPQVARVPDRRQARHTGSQHQHLIVIIIVVVIIIVGVVNITNSIRRTSSSRPPSAAAASGISPHLSGRDAASGGDLSGEETLEVRRRLHHRTVTRDVRLTHKGAKVTIEGSDTASILTSFFSPEGHVTKTLIPMPSAKCSLVEAPM
jgi:hypothetical protein